MKLSLQQLNERHSQFTGWIQGLDNAGSPRAARLDRCRARLDRVRDARRLARGTMREALVRDHLDDFSEFSDEAIRSVGGIVLYCAGSNGGRHRIVGLNAAQASKQSARLRRALIDSAIVDETAEWFARDIALYFIGITTERTSAWPSSTLAAEGSL